jgi:hypothetical protein
MKFPKYWKVVKNSTGLVVARGWSNHSEAEALKRAEARLQRILNWLRARSGDQDRYHYVIDDSQKCFRARLPPKPWRIGMLPPAQKFPFRPTPKKGHCTNGIAVTLQQLANGLCVRTNAEE